MNISDILIHALEEAGLILAPPSRKRKSPAESVYEISTRLVKYTRENKIDAVIFLDRGARLEATAFRAAYKAHCPEASSMPKTLFMNPVGFVSYEYLNELSDSNKILFFDRELARDGSLIAAKEKVGECTDSEIQRQLDDYFSKARLSKNSNIIIIDTCVHSGYSIEPVLRAFKQYGAKNVKFGVMASDKSSFPVKVDFIGTHEDMPCKPFRGVETDVILKPYNRITSFSLETPEIKNQYSDYERCLLQQNYANSKNIVRKAIELQADTKNGIKKLQ